MGCKQGRWSELGSRGFPGNPVAGQSLGRHFGRHILISALFPSPTYKPFWGSQLFCTLSAFTSRVPAQRSTVGSKDGSQPGENPDTQNQTQNHELGRSVYILSQNGHTQDAATHLDTCTRTFLPCLLLLFSWSVVSDSTTPWTAARQASLSFTISWSLLKFMSIESVMPSNHLVLCRHLLLLPSIFPIIRVFSNESALCIRWLQVLELQLQHQSPSEVILEPKKIKSVTVSFFSFYLPWSDGTRCHDVSFLNVEF